MSDIISVVAGGWSVSQVDQTRIPGTIIAINDSAIHLQRFDIAVSMDRLWTEHRYADLRRMQKPAHIRSAALKSLPDKWPWLRSFDCDYTSAEFSDRPGVLNGTNSGLCGFNLAWQMKPKVILLFGFDMKRGPNGQSHWFPDYPWARPGGATTSGKYREWSRQFESAKRSCDAAGIDVGVVGDSAIECFPKLAASEFARVPAYYWENRFNLVEKEGPFASIGEAKADAVDCLGGFAFDIAIVFEGTTVAEGHIKGGLWIDGVFSETAMEAERRLSAYADRPAP